MFNTSQTPSPVTAHWTAPTSLGQFTCLAHYEQTMDEVYIYIQRSSHMKYLRKEPFFSEIFCTPLHMEFVFSFSTVQ